MYLVTNTSQTDSLYLDGVRIASQTTEKFDRLSPQALIKLKYVKNIKVSAVKSQDSTVEAKIKQQVNDSYIVSKQRHNKKPSDTEKDAECIETATAAEAEDESSDN